MAPNRWPHTSLEACILRAILSVQLWGTWQSGQLARTPERFEKWMVDFSSANTLSRISWQLVQNFSVLVSSSAVLNPPQKITPATKPASTSTPSPNTELGRRSTSHKSRTNLHIRVSREVGGAAGAAVLIGAPPGWRDSA